MSKNTIILLQTLHGYSDGHTLLASSSDLPTEVRRIILNLSDMSGGRMEPGFEEYITGYPLKEANLYAVAKTWYAPEMSRPGCVWTHTILMNFSDLPRITNSEFLLSLFKRPTLKNFDQYRKEILVDDEINRADVHRIPSGMISKNLIKTLIKELYGSSSLPVFISSTESYNFDKLFLMIWQQQWPRLRRNFSFCTGAVAPRNLHGKPLDLQVIPYGLELTKGVSDVAINIRMHQDYNFTYEKWVEQAFEDFFSPSAPLKRFLNYFGSDVDIKRVAFKTLLQSFSFFKDEKPQLTDSIKFFAEKYPSIKDGANLKNAILGNEGNNFSMLPHYDESTVIFHLATTEHYKYFNYAQLNFKERFLRYFVGLNATAIEALKQIILMSPNPIGEEAITTLAGKVKVSEMHAIWKDRQLTTVFIGLNPRLTFSRDFWLANINNQQEIIHQLQRTEIDEDGWKTICSILIDIGSRIDPQLISNQISGLEKIILDTFNQESNKGIGENWLRYIRSNPAEVLEWMKSDQDLRPKTISILVDILNPNDKMVVSNGLLPWLHFLNNLTLTELNMLQIDIHIFCLSLAFNVKSVEAQEVFERTFENVYFALWSNSVDYSLWLNLEVHTKPLGWFKDWDKCKKLINALVDYFINNRYSIKPFISSIHNEELKDRILKQYKKRK